MAKLEVELGADVKELQSKLNQAQKDIQDFSKKSDANLGKFSSATNSAGKAVTGMGKSTANAVPAVTEFSRIIQDAPYGMQGVANNLQQLTANFGNLSKSAGGTLPALKLMVSSLAGPAGILLAVSAVTSAIVYFGNRSQKAAKEAEELAKKKQSLADTTKTYLESLEAVNQANLVGERSAAKELVNLDLLRSQINNTNLSFNDRISGVNELRRLYPDLLKNMTDEKILNGGLATVYDTLTGSILKRAKATAAMNAIVKNSETLLALKSQTDSKQFDLDKKKEAFLKKYGKTYEDVSKNLSGTGFSINVLNSPLLAGIVELNKELNTLQGQVQDLELSNIDLEASIELTPTIDPFKAKDPVNKLTKTLGLQMSKSFASLNLQPFDFLEEKILKFKDSATGIMRTIDFRGAPLLTGLIASFDIQAMEMQTRMQEFANAMQEIKDTSLTNAFIGIGDAIGGALANGGNVLQAIGMSLLRSFGGFLSQMGAQMILYGKLAIAKGKLDLAIAAGGPVAIAAGLASVKMGILVAAAGAALGALASGGFGGSSRSNAGTSTGSSGGGFTGGFSSGGGNQRVVFEIAGRKLIGVIQNEIRAQGNSGVNFAF